jgi:hypothetical protein
MFPEARLQDVYKNFHQDNFGTGHAISDEKMVLNYLQKELQNTDKSAMPKIEVLGWKKDFVRVSLDLIKENKIDGNSLAEAFIESSRKINPRDTLNWKTNWKQITEIIEKRKITIKNYENDKLKIDSVLEKNPNAAFHHSEAFNKAYKPHYRVVKKSVFREKFGKIKDFQ